MLLSLKRRCSSSPEGRSSAGNAVGEAYRRSKRWEPGTGPVTPRCWSRLAQDRALLAVRVVPDPMELPVFCRRSVPALTLTVGGRRDDAVS